MRAVLIIDNETVNYSSVLKGVDLVFHYSVLPDKVMESEDKAFFLLDRDSVKESSIDQALSWLNELSKPTKHQSHYRDRVYLFGMPLLELTAFAEKKPSKTPLLKLFKIRNALWSWAESKTKFQLSDVDYLLVVSKKASLIALEPTLRALLPRAKIVRHASSPKEIHPLVIYPLRLIRSSFNCGVLTMQMWDPTRRTSGTARGSGLSSRPKNQTKRLGVVVDSSWELLDSKGVVSSRYWTEFEKRCEEEGVQLEFLFVGPEFLKDKRLRQKNDIGASIQNQSLTVGQLFYSFFRAVSFNVRVLSNLYAIKRKVKYVDGSGLKLDYLVLRDVLRVLGSSPYICLRYTQIRNAVRRRGYDAVLERKPFNQSGKITFAASGSDAVTFGVQHGIVNSNQIGYRFLPRNESLVPLSSPGNLILPDVMCVFGQRLQKQLVGDGFSERKILVIGNPAWSRTERPDPKVKYLEGAKVRFLFVMQGNLQDMKNQAEIFLADFAIRPDFSLILRPHPAYRSLVCPFRQFLIQQGLSPDQVEVDCYSEIAETLMSVNVTLAHSSTAILDSIYMGVPVIILVMPGRENDQELYQQRNGLRTAQNSADFSGILNKPFISLSSVEERLLKDNIELYVDPLREILKEI